MNFRIFLFFFVVGIMLVSIFGSIAMASAVGCGLFHFYWHFWILFGVGIISYLSVGFVFLMLAAVAEVDYLMRKGKQTSKLDDLRPIAIGLFWLPFVIICPTIDFVVNFLASRDQKDWERA